MLWDFTWKIIRSNALKKSRFQQELKIQFSAIATVFRLLNGLTGWWWLARIEEDTKLILSLAFPSISANSFDEKQFNKVEWLCI